MSSTITINKTISFVICILKELEYKRFPFLKSLIELIDYYYNRFQDSKDIDYIKKIISKISLFQTYKDIISSIFNDIIHVLNDIISSFKEEYNKNLTLHLLELYNHFLDINIEEKSKHEQFKISNHLSSKNNEEILSEMFILILNQHDESVIKKNNTNIEIFYPSHEDHKISPVIEKTCDESKDEQLKRIIGKYGTNRCKELDKSPPKNNELHFY